MFYVVSVARIILQCIIENLWAYGERSNVRKRAVKRVNKVFGSLGKRVHSQPGKRPSEDGVEASASVASFEIDANESEEEVFHVVIWQALCQARQSSLAFLWLLLQHSFPPRDGCSLLKTTNQYVKVIRRLFILFGNIELPW